MAIIICPSCGGKISSTRKTCSHCGYELKATKVCPECEETIEENTKECPVCGYEFDSASVENVPEAEPVKENEVAPPPPPPPPAQETQSDKAACKFRRLTTKEQFLRSILLYLTENQDSPADVLKASFGEIEEDEIQGFVAMGVANGHYSATIGYDRTEKYVEQEYGFVGSNMHYTLNGHPRVGTGKNVMHDVEKTRTVTDWQPYNGNIVNENCSTVITEPPYEEWNFKICELLRKKDLDSLYDEFPETTDLSNNVYRSGRQNLAFAVECGISFPGDRVKDKRCSVSISEYSLIRCIVPIYKVYYEYEGKKYCAKSFAIDGISPIVEIPKQSQSVPTESGLRTQRENAVAKVKKPRNIGMTICIVLAILSGLLCLGNFSDMMIGKTLIFFSIMVCCIIGTIVLFKITSKKVGLIENAYNAKISKLKELKGLMLNKRINEFGLAEITESEMTRLGLSNVVLEAEFDIDSFMSLETGIVDNSIVTEDNSTVTTNNSTFADDKGKSAVTESGKCKGIFTIILAALNILSITALIVGSVCMIYDTNIFSAFRNRTPANVGYLLALGCAVIVFFSLLIQLIFDISKKANFKKTLLITIIAMVFNMAAAFFAYYSISRSIEFPSGTEMFIIFAVASLLFTIARLILAIVRRKKDMTKNNCKL